MKAVNPLRQKVLITTDEVIFHAPIDNDVDVRIILQSIVVAESRFIKPALGDTLYAKLCDAKNKLVDDVTKADLQSAINAGRPASRAPIILHNGDYVNSAEYLDSDDQALWRTHLHKLIAECVYFCALPNNHTRFSNKGVTQDNPKTQVGSGGVTSADLKDIKFVMDVAMRDRIVPLLEGMHAYLCAPLYPGYLGNCGGCEEPPSRKTDIVTSLYEEEEDCRCRF